MPGVYIILLFLSSIFPIYVAIKLGNYQKFDTSAFPFNVLLTQSPKKLMKANTQIGAIDRQTLVRETEMLDQVWTLAKMQKVTLNQKQKLHQTCPVRLGCPCLRLKIVQNVQAQFALDISVQQQTTVSWDCLARLLLAGNTLQGYMVVGFTTQLNK